ncbi:DUF1284 domain-containing protein [Rhodovulum sp. MB263]|uniref:DUF1284 domain-containing protein n=1 Tax=unclassified Rhodovulum TaxID=2631432 RepID=UPI0009B77A49|nr:DUF1284 domain-containing protein [Rhodovulum sp. MB263]ARC90782.1 2Fe-2S ferredoxin [Rhodovulum sp. MB263]
MTLRLRPHHLLCLLTFVGRGYSPAFTANMTASVGRLRAGEEAEIVDGPDDLCAPLLDGPEPHCHRCSVTARDRAAASAVGRLLGRTIRPGTRLRFDAGLVRRLRQAFAAGKIRSACGGCEWHELCSRVAASGYAEASL